MHMYWHQFINLTKAKKTLLKVRIVTLRLIAKKDTSKMIGNCF